MRGNNRDRSGNNSDFLCIKGRYARDFVQHPERIENPLMRKDGQLGPVSWAAAIEYVATRFRDSLHKGGSFAVIGSTRTTNGDDYCVQKFARQILRTPNIDHHRSGDVVTLIKARNGRSGALATTADLYGASAVLIIGADLAQQHPFLSWQIRVPKRTRRRTPSRRMQSPNTITRTHSGSPSNMFVLSTTATREGPSTCGLFPVQAGYQSPQCFVRAA
jgi:NADH-quinone oxidoreductase subunit G